MPAEAGDIQVENYKIRTRFTDFNKFYCAQPVLHNMHVEHGPGATEPFFDEENVPGIVLNHKYVNWSRRTHPAPPNTYHLSNLTSKTQTPSHIERRSEFTSF